MSPAVIVAIMTGYAVGCLLALLLDRVYTGASLRGPLALCKVGTGTPWLAYTGTVGYLLLRGRCSGDEPLPKRLWYLPVLGAAAAAAIALKVSDPLEFVLVSGFTTILLAFVGTDFERHLLPNRLMYPALTAATLATLVWPDHTILAGLAGGAGGFVMMFGLFIVFPGLGFGDVKLSALIGLLVGAPNVFIALMSGIIAGGVGVIFMLTTRQATRRTSIAYGPYLVLGAFYVMLMM